MSEIYERNDRGFHGYGRQPVTCSYKGTAEVYESSAAGERHVWLKVSDGYPLRASSEEGVAFLHLNAEAVHDLIDRLQTWLADRSPCSGDGGEQVSERLTDEQVAVLDEARRVVALVTVREALR